MVHATATVQTPVGPFTIVTDPRGAVLAGGFTAEVEPLLQLVHPSLRPGSAPDQRQDLGEVTKAVERYFSGDLDAVAAFEVRQLSDGEFLGSAWNALRTVRPGAPVTYRGLAGLAGRPSAVRAAAAACARNPAALFVPCHRVLRSDGSLGGYRWGTTTKRWLLEHESPERNAHPADR